MSPWALALCWAGAGGAAGEGERPVTAQGPPFRSPPVAEVALAIYFSPPLAFRAVHLGLLWERWREHFPRTEDQPPLPPVLPESFGPAARAPHIQVVGPGSGFRVWFLSEQGDRVLQLQRDRLVYNWRRVGPDDGYPRYRALRPAFAEAAEQLIAFTAEEEIGEVSIHQAEVSYSNPIPLSSVGADGDAARLLAPWSGAHSDDFLPRTEDLRVETRYRIPAPAGGDPVGRLYVQAAPALHVRPGAREPEEVFLLQLFARGSPLGMGLEGAMEFLDIGHYWVVNGFKSYTTRPMHDQWGLQEG